MAYVNAAYVDLGKVWGFDKKTRNQQGFYDNAWVWGDSAPEGESFLPCSYFYVLGQKDNLGFTPTTIDFDVRTGLLSVQGTQEGVDRVFMRNYMVGAPAPRFLNVRQSQRSRRPADLPVVAIITDDDESLPNIKEYLGLIEEVAEAEQFDAERQVYVLRFADPMRYGKAVELPFLTRNEAERYVEMNIRPYNRKFHDDIQYSITQEIESFGAENDPDFDPEKADRNKDGKISDWERAVGNAVAKSMREQKEEKSAEDWSFSEEYDNYYTRMNARMGTPFYGDVIVSAYGYDEEEGREIEKEVVSLSLFLKEKIKEWFADRSNRASNFTWSGRKGNRTLKKISQGAEEFGADTADVDFDEAYMERQDAERIMRLLRTVKRKATGSNARYAKTYADAAEMAYYDYGFKGLKAQVAYVLSNLGGWRGDEAKKVKAELRKLIK